MIEVDWKWLIPVIVSAIGAVYYWLTRVYWPVRQKMADDMATSAREFNEATQGSAFAQVLATQRQLIDHLIANNNGHLTALTRAVTAGDDAHSTELRQVVAGINKLLVLMSQQQASFRGIANGDDPMTATIKSVAVRRADAVVAEAEREVEDGETGP